jgi:pyruvate/2-oxoglutarate dehydrogenase complex dihydrolipoamide dehydrogenase (E3) component
MESMHFPTIVIGSGSAGLTVANSLSQLGRAVALIESKSVGGDCTNVGCIPSKTLIHEASRMVNHEAASALLTVRSKRDKLRDEETHHVKHTEYLTFIHGAARFVAPKRIAVSLDDGTTREITGDHIVIATGSRPATLKIDGLPSHRTLTNDTLFELPAAPAHLAIIGSGPVALEMAFAFKDLGSRVTMVTLDNRVLNKGPQAASATLHQALTEQGIEVYYRSTPSRYDELSNTLLVQTPDGSIELADVDKVLIAIGRQRNIDKIGLEHAGVKFDPKTGIEIDDHGQTNVSGIFAIGDVTPTSYWTHSANAQGRRVVQRILFPWLPALGAEQLYPNATFSAPEVANVGLMPDEIAKKYHPKLVKTLQFDLPKTDKGYTDGLNSGFVQVSALRLTGRILGATIVGPHASEMISFFTLAITQHISLYKLFRLVYPYPTLSGAIQKVADQYVRETLPAFHTELYTVTRYGLETAWHRIRGVGFESPDTTPIQSEPIHSDNMIIA